MNKNKNLKFIPYGHQEINDIDVSAVSAVLKGDFLTQGPKIKEFEGKLAKVTGAKYAVAVSNGTSALHVAYLSAGLKEGDEVITTPNTFVATTNMLLVIGAKPVFCDIRLDNYNIDETKIEALITKKTKAIVPVHFSGQPCDMDTISKIAKKYKLKVITDACHALGASYKSKGIGELSDLAVLSFHPVKSITTGEGGAILTNDENFYKKALLLRSHGIFKDKKGFNVMQTLGFNYRISDIQAALGSSQLNRLDSFIEKRRKIVLLYRTALGDQKNIILPTENESSKSAWHLYIIRVKDPKDRIPLYNHLRNSNIGVNFHYPQVYAHPYYRKNGFKNIRLVNDDLYAKTAMTLPIFPALKKTEVLFVVEKINEYFTNKK